MPGATPLEPSLLLEGTAGTQAPWETRLQDPFNRFYRYPLARLLVRGLNKAEISPDRFTFAGPIFAAFAGYFITFADSAHLALAAGLFEIRSILASVDEVSARSKTAAASGDLPVAGMADRLSVLFLSAGIFWHFHLHPPPRGEWSQYLSVNGILLLCLLQGVVRAFSADYYRRKYTSIFERGHDETVSSLRESVLVLGPKEPVFAHIDVFFARLGHLCFEQEWFDPQRSPITSSDETGKQLIREQSSPSVRVLGLLWSLSNGEAFLSFVVLTLATDLLWPGQLFFASVGVAWIVGVILLNGWFLRSASRLRSPLPPPPLEIP